VRGGLTGVVDGLDAPHAGRAVEVEEVAKEVPACLVVSGGVGVGVGVGQQQGPRQKENYIYRWWTSDSFRMGLAFMVSMYSPN
jgi:hypothetical protein